jgi:hypothetical protein
MQQHFGPYWAGGSFPKLNEEVFPGDTLFD